MAPKTCSDVNNQKFELPKSKLGDIDLFNKNRSSF
jgi:hypothetical protein